MLVRRSGAATSFFAFWLEWILRLVVVQVSALCDFATLYMLMFCVCAAVCASGLSRLSNKASTPQSACVSCSEVILCQHLRTPTTDWLPHQPLHSEDPQVCTCCCHASDEHSAEQSQHWGAVVTFWTASFNLPFALRLHHAFLCTRVMGLPVGPFLIVLLFGVDRHKFLGFGT